jgi:hypothetical protein
MRKKYHSLKVKEKRRQRMEFLVKRNPVKRDLKNCEYFQDFRQSLKYLQGTHIVVVVDIFLLILKMKTNQLKTGLTTLLSVDSFQEFDNFIFHSH